MPFMGSDGRVHLVYELGMTNFSSAEIVVEKVEVIGDGVTLQTLDTARLPDASSPPASANPRERLPGARRQISFFDVVACTRRQSSR